MRKYRRPTSRKGLYFVIGGILLVIIAFAAVAIILNTPPKPLPPASQYLSITPGEAIAESITGNTTILIKTVSFGVKAIGGSATSILIEPKSAQGPYEMENSLAKDQFQATSDIQLRGEVSTYNSTVGKYPIKVRVGCAEAVAEMITVYFDPDYVTITPSI